MALRRTAGIFSILILFSFTADAHAGLRRAVPDADLVDRSTLIVVGGIKEGSVVYVPDKAPAGSGQSWEHHAILLVHEVLNGECKDAEIPIVIHYGLDPLIDGQRDLNGNMVSLPQLPGTTPGAIEIDDTGNSMSGMPPLTIDARQDNLWFLRRRAVISGEKTDTGDFGIIDPEDLRPMPLKDYLLCYRAKDPESAVRRQFAKQPEIAVRAMAYLDHCEIARTAKLSDPAQRVERLIPYYMDRSTRDEAENLLIAQGPVAGPYLLGVYDRVYDPNIRDHIIPLWGRIRWAGCEDLLIDLLKKSDQYWAAQKLEAGWWSHDPDSPLTQQRRQMYSPVYHAVCTLHQIGDPKAIDAIKQTRERWSQINFENAQIVEECDRALKDLAAKASIAQPSPPANTP